MSAGVNTKPRLNNGHVEPLSAGECRALAPWVRAELRRHFLSERERLVAEAIMEVSLVYGLPSVLIPKLEVISDLTGIPRPHVHGTLKSLVEMRILTVSDGEGMPRYELNGDSDTWKVKVRVARATVRRAMDLMCELNHQAHQAELGTNVVKGHAALNGESKPNFFRDFSRAIFLPAVVTDSGTVTKEDGERIVERAQQILRDLSKV